MTDDVIRVGTRGSRLALAQARLVAEDLRRQDPSRPVKIEPFVTEGDEGPPSKPPPRGGTKALFTRRIDAALLDGRIDVAVHSMKDLPAEPVDGLKTGAVPAREEPRDALVTRDGRAWSDQTQGFRVGTGSLRRRALLVAARPDVVVQPIRGNVDTRLRKMKAQDLDALVLAAAGLHRLGRSEMITELLPTRIMLPAPGQGALAVQARTDDEDILRRLRRINDAESRTAVDAERALAAALGSDCNVPVGAFASKTANELRLDACVARPDGGVVLRESLGGNPDDPRRLGARLAGRLLDAGAAEILEGADPR